MYINLEYISEYSFHSGPTSRGEMWMDWISNCFSICLPCPKRSPNEEAAMHPSKLQPLHIFVPAGFNGPIVNYTDYYTDEVLCKYIWESFFLGCCCWETGAYWNMCCFSYQGDAWELGMTCTIVHDDIFLCFFFPCIHSTTGAIFENETNLVDLLYSHMDKHCNTSAPVWMKITCFIRTVNTLGASYELVAGVPVIFQSHIMRHFKILSPVEGASAPLCRFLSVTVFSVCQEKVGQIFRYFVKNLFRTLWVLATLTYQRLRKKKALDHRHYASTYYLFNLIT